jgi:hypothetical protein
MDQNSKNSDGTDVTSVNSGGNGKEKFSILSGFSVKAHIAAWVLGFVLAAIVLGIVKFLFGAI